MKSEQEALYQAFNDLALIRRAIEKVDLQRYGGLIRRVTLGTNLLIQVLGLFIAVIFLISEILTNHAGSQAMQMSVNLPKLQAAGVFNVGIFLVLLILFLYTLVWRASREAASDFTKYVADNFVYLKNMSLFSDLLVKYCFFAALILAGKPQWVAPVLTLCIGDYLVQGRFFTLPLRSSLVLGLICIVFSVVQYQLNASYLVWPLAIFSVISACSIGYLLYMQRTCSAASSDMGQE